MRISCRLAVSSYFNLTLNLKWMRAEQRTFSHIDDCCCLWIHKIQIKRKVKTRTMLCTKHKRQPIRLLGAIQCFCFACLIVVVAGLHLLFIVHTVRIRLPGSYCGWREYTKRKIRWIQWWMLTNNWWIASITSNDFLCCYNFIVNVHKNMRCLWFIWNNKKYFWNKRCLVSCTLRIFASIK